MQVYSMGFRGTGQCYASVFHGFQRGLRGTGQCYSSVFHGFERYWSVLFKCIPWV